MDWRCDIYQLFTNKSGATIGDFEAKTLTGFFLSSIEQRRADSFKADFERRYGGQWPVKMLECLRGATDRGEPISPWPFL